MKKIIILLLVALGFSLQINAQERPKMHLKAKILGTHGLNYVYKEAEKTNDYFAGVNGGFSFRVYQKRKMGEIGFDFLRSYIDYSEGDSSNIEIKLNAFELPITVGYVTTSKPIFKHFIYGGITTHFNIKSFVTFSDETTEESFKLKPRDLALTNPNFAMRFGTQIDVAMFNFELNYDIGLNKTFKGNTRTQSHQIQLNMGLVF